MRSVIASPYRARARRAWGAVCALALSAGTVGGQPIQYAVQFRGDIVATQHVFVARGDERTTVRADFEADELHVFVAVHRYAESLEATFDREGRVHSFAARVADGPRIVELRGDADDGGNLSVVRVDRDGGVTNRIARDEYDFCSLALYGSAPGDFLPTNQPARVLRVDRGVVVPMQIDKISESHTFERQNLKSDHLIWRDGERVWHSWHPEKFSNLPSRFVRQTDEGEFIFTLMR